MTAADDRRHALDAYRAKLIDSREWEAKLKALRLEIKDLQKEYDRTEENIKALQSVGQIIGEVLKQLDDESCESCFACSSRRKGSGPGARPSQLFLRRCPCPPFSHC